jgi:PEP-CTERM motif
MRVFRLTAAAVFLAASAVSSYAGSVMHINDGTAYLFSGEVHPISSPTVSILENGGGQPSLVNPLLLVVGVPNTTAFAAPSLSLSTGSADLGGPGSGTNSAFGGSFSATTGRATNNGGLFNSGEVYSFIGLTGGNNSNSFSNWSAADAAVNGLSVSGFGVFVYELTNTGMSGGNNITATFNGSIPVGTFVVAYGHSADGTVFDTPFTETGLVTGVRAQDAPTPEPASLVLLGTGLSALYARRRRRSRR